MAELDFATKDIQDVNGLPFVRVTTFEKGRGRYDSIYVRQPNKNTYAPYGPETVKLLEAYCKSNLKALDLARPKLRFKKSQVMTQHLHDYYSKLSGMFKSQPCDTCLVSTSIELEPDSTVKKESKRFIIDSTYLRSKVRFDQQLSILHEQKTKADIPDIATSLLFFPYSYIGSKFGKGWIHKTTVL